MINILRTLILGFYVGALSGVASLVTGCGAAPEQDEASDIGQAEQGISIPHGHAGLADSTLNQQCLNDGSTNCLVPNNPTKTIGVCFGPGLTSAQMSNINVGVGNVRSTIMSTTEGWTFPVNPATCQVTFLGGTVSGGSTGNVDKYTKNVFVNKVSLAHDVHAPVGTWLSFDGIQVTIDTAKATTDGYTSGFYGAFGEHGVFLGMGLGLTTDAAHNGSPSRRVICPNGIVNCPSLGFSGTTGEFCMAGAYNGTTAGIITQGFTTCGF